MRGPDTRGPHGYAVRDRGIDLPGFYPAVYPRVVWAADCIPRTCRLLVETGTLDAEHDIASDVPVSRRRVARTVFAVYRFKKMPRGRVLG